MGYAQNVKDTVLLKNLTRKRETEKAVLVELPNGESHWLPFSAIHRIDDKPDGSIDIVIDKWILDKRGIEY